MADQSRERIVSIVVQTIMEDLAEGTSTGNTSAGEAERRTGFWKVDSMHPTWNVVSVQSNIRIASVSVQNPGTSTIITNR